MPLEKKRHPERIEKGLTALPRVLHIFTVLPEKYGSDFARLMAKGSSEFRHYYFAYTPGPDEETHPFPGNFTVLPTPWRDRLAVLKKAMLDIDPDIVVFHHFGYEWRGAAFFALADMLVAFSNRSIWSIWGADLYYDLYPRPLVGRSLGRLFRSLFLRRLRHVTSFVPGDSAKAVERYCPKATRHDAFYPFHVVTGEGGVDPKRKGHIVQVGNSADPMNRHEFIFEVLGDCDARFDVFCPIAYGGSESYRNSVMSKGEKIFGERIKFLTKMTTRERYEALLLDTESAVFAHPRQQALGNILIHLHIGNAVFLESNTTHYQFLRQTGYDVHAIDQIRHFYSSKRKPTHCQRKFDKSVIDRFGDDVALEKWQSLFATVSNRTSRRRDRRGQEEVERGRERTSSICAAHRYSPWAD